MSLAKTLIAAVVAGGTLASCGTTPPVPTTPDIPLLFGNADIKTTDQPLIDINPQFILRARYTTLNLDLLHTMPDKQLGSGSVNINLFPDTAILVPPFHPTSDGTGGVSWEGAGLAESGTRFSFRLRDRTLVGDIRTETARFRVAPVGTDGLHAISEFNLAVFHEGNDYRIPPRTPSFDELKEADILGGKQCDVQRPTPFPVGKGNRIRILYAFTPEARQQSADIHRDIDLIADEVAQVWKNSNFIVIPETAYVIETAYKENKDMSIDLDHLTKHNDGVMDELHRIRNNTKADLVTLLVAGSSDCGLAWVNEPIAKSSEGWAFSVVDRSCALGGLTMPHELGHNIGMMHDRFS